MKMLFIDTHSEKITIIIKIGENEIIKTGSSNRSHSELAMPLIQEAFNDSGIKPQEIEEIIIVNGPGSFTGVRIGVTIAKTLAYTLNVPIKTISSLEMYGVSSEEDFDLVTINDPKGVFSAKKGIPYENFIYQSNEEFNQYVEENSFKLLQEKIINMDKIIDYLKDASPINPHLVNPIYIKEIEAQK